MLDFTLPEDKKCKMPANVTAANKKKLSDTDEQGNSRYRCVEVLPGSLDCCQAVQDILGQRFLSKQIPSLPLDACDAQDCRCSYEFLADRRTSVRRVSDAVGNTTLQFVEMHDRHRVRTGRREGD
jgi:hypothetical protein